MEETLTQIGAESSQILCQINAIFPLDHSNLIAQIIACGQTPTHA